MILGIGVDTVEVDRFLHWTDKSYVSLRRIFSDQEINYARSCDALTAQRLAVRFAAKEAFYKAYCQAGVSSRTLLEIMKKVSVATGGLQLIVEPSLWQGFTGVIRTHLSLTHSAHTGVAVVIIESV